MANPFFNATYYNQQNKDVYVSGMDAYTHYVQFGASEALEGAATRKPAPWFDIEFYYENNPDLIAAKLTPAQLFDHFANYGYKEGRAPNAIAQENVNADSLLTYALANADLREAFGIDADATELTAAQYVDLAGHYYQFGYNEARPGLPSTEGGGEIGADQYLTVGKDDITVEGDNNTVYAPIEQNFLGAVTNTLESGDIIRGEDGSVGNTLVADLTLSVSGTIPVGPAISATTNNIDKVVLRAQTGNTDLLLAEQGNFSHIDAENFHGVKEWFSDNSRASIQIEDVRTKPEDTTIGLSNSDPFVGFRVYFDPQQLTNQIRVQDSALTIKLLDITNPASLADVPVDGVSFKLDGKSYTVQSDEMGAATTHEEFVAALEAALAENEALAGLKVTLNADNTITLVDPNGAAFEKGGWKFINDEVPADGNIAYEQNVGEPDLREELITTNVVLDNVGRTSQGGIVDIGSLGAGGVQQFDVKVGDSSWVTALESVSYLGRGEVEADVADRFLEVVNIGHLDGAKGNLTIGNAVPASTDNRVVEGLTDVRELNAADFSGDLKVGINLTEDVARRYLNDAEEPVEFSYTTGSGNDNVTLDIHEDIAEDPDFALSVDLGAGDDRLNLWLNGADADKVSVNGGEGYNTIEVNSTHGVNATNTFANFENFQKYVVAGDVTTTTHNFANMAGVEQVVVATVDGVDTTLLNLEEDTAVSISGKNQTLGADNNEDQEFGDITINGAAGAALTVSLDNTARLNGELEVDELNIDNALTSTLANTTVRTLDLASNGKRDVENTVDQINARFVNTFNITGTQDLTATINSAANSGAAAAAARGNFVVDASKLAANIDLTINAEVASRIDAAADRTNTFTGAEGAGDSLTFANAFGGHTTTQATTIKGFETVNFALDGDGNFDATNVSGVEQYNLNAGDNFGLTNLAEAVNVDIKAEDVTGNVGLFGAGNAINISLTSANTVGSWNAAFDGAAVPPTGKLLAVAGYKTINLDLNNTSVNASVQQNYEFTLDLDPIAADPVVARELVLTGGRGVTQNGATSDSVTLNDLDNNLRTIDLRDYAGHVTGSMEDPAGGNVSNVTVLVGSWNMNWDVKAEYTYVPEVPAVGVPGDPGYTPAVPAHLVGAGDITYNTTFKFTDASNFGGTATSTWQIENFVYAGVGTVDDGTNVYTGTLDGSSLNNYTKLDVSDLGITSYTDLKVINDNGNTIVVSRSEYNEFDDGTNTSLVGNQYSWKIELLGVELDGNNGFDLNFIYAV